MVELAAKPDEPVSDADLPNMPFIKPADDSPEMHYLRERRKARGTKA